MSKQVILAYCKQNIDAAYKIESELSKVGYAFNHVSEEKEPIGGQLKATADSPVLLILTDNFLRSADCLYGGVGWLQRLQSKGQLMLLVTDGNTGEGNKRQVVKTSFEKVSSVIKYMNYWQDRYLEMRKEKRSEDADNLELNKTRDISSEIGEFLRLVRSSEYILLEDLARDNYSAFFKKMDDEEAYAKLNSLSPKADEPAEALSEEIPAFVQVEQEVEEQSAKSLHTSKVESDKAEENIIADVIISDFDEGEDLFDEEEAEVIDESLLQAIPGMNLLSANDDKEEEDSAEEPNDTTMDGADFEEEFDLEFEAENEEGDAEEENHTHANENYVISAEDLINSDEYETAMLSDDLHDDKTEKQVRIEAILKKSRALLKAGDVPDALNILKKATEEYGDEINLRYYYAYVLANSADNANAAKQELVKVFLQSPMHADAHYLSGEIAELDGDYYSAKKHYASVVQSDEDYPNAQYRLAYVIAKRFLGKEKEALTHFEKAIQQDASNQDAVLQAAKLYLKTGEISKAEKYFLQYLKVNEETSEVYLALAEIARTQTDVHEAFEYYRKAVDIEPNLATAENQLKFAPNLVSSDAISPKDKKINELKGKLAQLEAQLKAEKEQLNSIQNPNRDKLVLITGATSGIGRATAELFAKNGFRLLLTGRRVERLEQIKIEFVREYDADIQVLNYDVRDPNAVNAALDSLEESWQSVDILINNAGLAKGFSSIHEGEMHHWEQMIDTNIKGLLYMTRAITPGMVKRRKGHVINVCSTAGHEVYPNGNVYCATKHAVDALTKSMRIDLHKHNIRVGQISPGHVEETEFARVRFDGDAERAKIYEDFRPLTSRDVAAAIYFMATQPAHVNIQDVLMMGTQQANSNYIDRSGR